LATGRQKPSAENIDEPLLRDFPAQITAIRRLRTVDATMAEICRDYEEIAVLMAAPVSTDAGSQNPALNNLAETLAGLRAEIEEILTRQRSD
jgi:hypothetical protein